MLYCFSCKDFLCIYYIRRRIEAVITGRTRNAFALRGTRVRIPPSPLIRDCRLTICSLFCTRQGTMLCLTAGVTYRRIPHFPAAYQVPHRYRDGRSRSLLSPLPHPEPSHLQLELNPHHRNPHGCPL